MSDRLDGLHPLLKDKAEKLIELAKSEGIDITITQGLRTTAEQNKLYAQGRTAPGKKVTNAKGGYSYHNFGLAFDIAVVDDDGEINWNVDKRWLKVGQLGKSLGLEWGGDFKSFKDYPHFQMTDGLSTADLRSGKKPSFPTLDVKAAASKKQDKDPIIEAIQSTLNERYKTKITVDGVHGDGTMKALIKGLQTELNLKQEANLKVDGVWGAKTKNACVSIRLNSKGNYVWIAQAALFSKGYDTSVDGIFDRKTTNAVLKFQKNKGLTQDGIIGKNTFDKLFN